MLSNAGEEEEVVETVLPVKVAKEEVVVKPEDETEVEDNTYVGESRSVIKGNYRLNKNSVEPPMTATAVKRYLQISFV